MEENTVFFCYIPTGLGTMESNFSRKLSKFTSFSHFCVSNPASFHCISFLLFLSKKPIKVYILSKAVTGNPQERF